LILKRNLLSLALLWPSAALAAENVIPFPALVERTVGVAGKSVRFDWRKKQSLVFANVGQPVEYNNFETYRAAAAVQFPSENMTIGLGLAKAFVFSTESADAIALMPYRQTGRPERWELELSGFYPVAEGVVTFRPDFMPAAQMVFSLAADVRYMIYPSLLSGQGFSNGFKSLIATRLSESDKERLSPSAPAAMKIDSAKIAVLTGFNLHLYTSGGLIISSKAMLALSILGTAMPKHADLTIGLGYAR
jgi:hypothetical protein